MSCAAASDSVHARPGVMELLDEARAEGLKLAVCSAATKSSVAFCIKNLLGEQRYEVRPPLGKLCLCASMFTGSPCTCIWVGWPSLPSCHGAAQCD